jgi:hypothetical protein
VEWAREQLEASRQSGDGQRCVLPPLRGIDLDAVQIGNASSNGDGSVHEEIPDAVITFRGPLSVVACLEGAIDAFTLPPEPRWRALARLLQHVEAEWRSQPKHRDPIFERDGWRCTVPACTSRRKLHDHHVIFRSRGGDGSRKNRTTVCAAHHIRHIHNGTLRAERTPSGAIEWWLGVNEGTDHCAFLRFIGDEYVEPQPLIP